MNSKASWLSRSFALPKQYGVIEHAKLESLGGDSRRTLLRRSGSHTADRLPAGQAEGREGDEGQARHVAKESGDQARRLEPVGRHFTAQQYAGGLGNRHRLGPRRV